MNLIADIEWHATRTKEEVTSIDESRIASVAETNLTLPSCSPGPLGLAFIDDAAYAFDAFHLL